MKNELIKLMSTAFSIDISQINEKTASTDTARWDSINHLNLIITLEEHYGIKFSSDEIVELVDFKAIEKCVKEKL